ncbi:hypothetical protein KBTX_02664 [wastewater metagenome]|uniref:Uncharacterized protein n=2 Tax=unclassified sequences TaxID=12908 RepID=A0A5B8RFL3_9ZZZZ|nr:hypothetical protein [Arhodomonas sp. KWT]QEA06332.1 hypothetical protein KBTEX_02664 [uncultured organism]
MKKSELEDLITTVETLRKQKFQNMDRKFIEEVIRAEEENPEDDGEAFRRIKDALEGCLADKGVE